MDPQNQNQSFISPTPESQASPAPAQAAIPSAWPGPFGVYKYSKAAVRVNVWLLIGLGLLNFAIYIVFNLILNKNSALNSAVLQLVALVVSSFFTVASIRVLVAGMRREKLTLTQAFSNVFPLFVKVILQQLATLIIVAVSAVFFVIPVFFVLPRLALIHYYLIIEDQGVIESIKSSWAATKGHVLKVYGIFGASILMGVLAITIIGIPFAIYFLIMYEAAYTILYGYVKQNSVASLAPPPATSSGTPPVTPAASPTPPIV